MKHGRAAILPHSNNKPALRGARLNGIESPPLGTRSARHQMAQPLTRLLLCRKLSREFGLPQSVIREVLGSLLDAISESLAAGDNVRISRFGAFEPREQAPVTGRNFLTGEALRGRRRTVVRFRASRSMKKRLRS